MNIDPPVLVPSILAADYTRLGQQIEACTHAGSEWIHCDIMDGHFVPNISFGPKIVKAVGQSNDVFLDVHLMIEQPDRFAKAFVEAGANLLTVHQETCPHLHRTIQYIKQLGAKAGVAINPATPLGHIEPIINDIDLLLIMTVNPGFGGQSFIESMYTKIEEAVLLRRQKQASFVIEADGGINQDNIKRVGRAGTDVFVAGSNVFGAPDISGRVKELTKKINASNDLYV